MIRTLLESKVALMDANGETYTPLVSEPDWQNLRADDMDIPVVFFDMPIRFKPRILKSGAYQREWIVLALFLFKDELGSSPEEQASIMEKAYAAQRQFHLLLNDDPENFKSVVAGECYEVLHLFDCDLSGVVFPFQTVVRNTDSVCVPKEE